MTSSKVVPPNNCDSDRQRKYFISARHGRKPQNCRWNFNANCHSYRVSGLGGHIAISGLRSLLLSFGDTFFDVTVVGKLDFVTIKFCQFKKNSHVFDVMPNNFWCTDCRTDCCIHIQEKSRKDSAQC